jgi:hypothetical protein
VSRAVKTDTLYKEGLVGAIFTSWISAKLDAVRPTKP